MRNKRYSIFTLLIMTIITALCTRGYAAEMTIENQAKFGLAQSLNNSQKFSEAQPILKSLYSQYPKDANVQREMIKAFGYDKKLSIVSELIREIEKNNPNDADLWLITGSVFEVNNQPEEAKNRYIKALSFDKFKGNSELLTKLINVLIQLKEYERAEQYLNQIKDNTLLSQNIWKLKKAEILFNLKKWSAVIETFSQIEENDLKPYQWRQFISALQSSGNNDKAENILLTIHKNYPDKSIALLDLYLQSEDNQIVQSIIEEVLASDNASTDQLRQIIDSLTLTKNYKESIRLLKRILSKYPSDKYTRQQLARVLSWDKQYQKSLELYDQLIKEYPDWTEIQREQARVYGWENDYAKAQKAYEDIKQNTAGTVIQEEYLAKKYLYKNFDRHAVKHYQAWIDTEPDNPEAIFDLAQIYSRLRDWEDAQKLYDKLLTLYPNHSIGITAQKSLQQIREDWQLNPSISFFESDSASRSNDLKYFRWFNELEKNITAKWSLGIKQEEHWYSFHDINEVRKDSMGIGLGLHPHTDLEIQMDYLHAQFTDDISSQDNWQGQIAYKRDEFQLRYNFLRDSFFENSRMLKAGLKADTHQIVGQLPLNNRWSIQGLYAFKDISDENSKWTYSGETIFEITGEPKRLALRYSYEAYGFDTPKTLYFSPDNFHSHKWDLEWRQYLNKYGLFWGSQNIYYDMKYTFQLDVHGQIAHQTEVKWHQDITDTWGWEAGWNIKRYEHPSVYKENNFTLKGVFYF